MRKHHPVNSTHTLERNGTYTVTFTMSSGIDKVVYNVAADVIDEYETSGVGVEEFFYTLV